MTEGLLHDGAFATTQSIIDAFPEGYFGNDKAQAFYEIYIRIKAGMKATLIHDDLMQRRLRPTSN